ncbi:hypothetical protein cypCar_00011300 [Cyprinus carpio]|nr:hypothetical protein cypCar_00011300 [Cyprinus carpio]
MNLITAFLLMILTDDKLKSYSTGHGTSDYVQKLFCPYENKNITLKKFRVWCKRDATNENCCSGISFLESVNVLEQGNIAVEDDGKSFTVSVKTFTQGDGVYWCGFMTEGNIIIKLAEDYFTNMRNRDTKKA